MLNTCAFRYLIISTFIFITGCRVDKNVSPAGSEIARLAPIFDTTRDIRNILDSPAIWSQSVNKNWLLVTAKEGDKIVVYDAATGDTLPSLGKSGNNPGELAGPNGIVVLDSLVFVTERINRRVQVAVLPEFRSIGIFGKGILQVPLGITAFKRGGGYEVYVTDNYLTSDEKVPSDSLLYKRVHHFKINVFRDSINVNHVGSFGATSGPGVLRIVESIYADPENNRLLVADELMTRSQIKLYDLNGKYLNQNIDSTYFNRQAEGITLYKCGDGSGYWIATDQDLLRNMFHVFDRGHLDYLGTFSIDGTRSTDGITLTQNQFGPFNGGAFYAVNDDGDMSAVSWNQIAEALSLNKRCQ